MQIPILHFMNENCNFELFFLYSKPAITDHLEIDQYMWAILNTLNSSDTEDVTIDSGANWKAVRPLNGSGIKVRIKVRTLPGLCS